MKVLLECNTVLNLSLVDDSKWPSRLRSHFDVWNLSSSVLCHFYDSRMIKCSFDVSNLTCCIGCRLKSQRWQVAFGAILMSPTWQDALPHVVPMSQACQVVVLCHLWIWQLPFCVVWLCQTWYVVLGGVSIPDTWQVSFCSLLWPSVDKPL